VAFSSIELTMAEQEIIKKYLDNDVSLHR